MSKFSATLPAAIVHDRIRFPPDASLSEVFDIPALVPAPGGAILEAADGCCRMAPIEEARALFREGQVLVAHGVFVAGRLKTAPHGPLFDVLELFAFVRPGVPFVPSPVGLARALLLEIPRNAEEQARVLRVVAKLLLEELQAQPEPLRVRARALAGLLARSGWRWGAAVLRATGEPEKSSSPIAGLEVWRALPQWEDDAPPAKPSSFPVAVGETRARLAQLVGDAGESRPEQGDYAEAAAYAFGPREAAGAPKVALVEAGTGIGKTLGYLAPASLWAEKNGPGLWISTYTRNLQRQIVQEMARLYPDPAEREEKAVVRKGRENYLCLLNFEEAAKRTRAGAGSAHRGAGADRALDRGDTGRRYFGRGLSRVSGRVFAACAKSPTGAANASMPRARIIASASSSARSGARAMLRSSSPIMRW